jgi:PadR family transcriptional regulator, regulatory protein AphA
MSLPYALLGLVNYKPATGYDLKTIFTRSINMFWNASLPQIYRTLNQMEKDGWLSSSIEHQKGKPSKKIYKITATGKKELGKWLSSPTDPVQIKNELMMKVFFGSQMNSKDLIRHIKEYRGHAVKFLQKTPKQVEAVVKDFSAAAGLDDADRRLWLLTYDFGRRRAKMTVEWCDSALKLLGQSG